MPTNDKMTDSLHELAKSGARIEERVDTLIHRQEESREAFRAQNEELFERVRKLELEVAVMGKDTKSHAKTFEKVFDIGFKLVATVLGALLLLKLGLGH